MQPDVLVFDAYGTLFDVHSVTQRCEALFPGKGAALSRQWRSRQLEYTWQRSLMQRYVDFNQVTQDSLRYACNTLACEYSPSVLDELMQAYRRLATFPDTVATLDVLAARDMPLAILSNGAPSMLDAVVAHNGLRQRFAAILSVDAVRTFKPAPIVYQQAVEHFGITATRIGFVSSNGWDAAGAKAFGFQVFWINRGGMPEEELGVPPDHVLTSLADLPALLD